MNDNTLIAEIEGYASVFHARDLNGDIVAPGAFKASLARRDAPVRMLYQHAAETPIGRWTSFAEDQYGLFVTGELILSSARAREVHALLKGGALDGLSIGYQAVKARKDKGAGRRIIEASLWEVSIVTFPMATAARITHVGAPHPEKSAHDSAQTKIGLRVQPGRASVSSPSADVRHFADALRGATSLLV